MVEFDDSNYHVRYPNWRGCNSTVPYNIRLYVGGASHYIVINNKQF